MPFTKPRWYSSGDFEFSRKMQVNPTHADVRAASHIHVTRSTDEHLVRNVTVMDMGLSDHFAVNFNIAPV